MISLAAVGTALDIGASLLGGLAGSDARESQAAALQQEMAYNKIRTGFQLKLLEDRRGFTQAQLDRGLIFQRRAIRRGALKTAGAQRAGFAKSGVDVSAGGSPMEILTETAALADYDARIASYNRTVSGLLTDYETDMNAIAIRMESRFQQAALSKKVNVLNDEASASVLSGILGAASATIGGISGFLSSRTSGKAYTGDLVMGTPQEGSWLGTGHSQPYG